MRSKALVGLVFLVGILTLHAGTASNKKEIKPDVAAKVRAAVERYVQRDQQLKGAFFLRDPVDKTVRDLRFDHVHEGVEKTPENLYTVCVDFLDQSKNRLDIDFYLRPTNTDDFQVSKIKVHKVNGVERKQD